MPLIGNIVGQYLDTLICRWPASVRQQVGHCVRLLGTREAGEIHAAELVAYRRTRRGEGVSDATVNRELTYLRAAFRQAVRAGILDRGPAFWPLLPENNIRRGFLGPEEIRRLLHHLKPDLADFISFLFFTGWRRGSVAKLTWDQVDWPTGRVFLDGAKTKNGCPIVFPINAEVRRVLLERKKQMRGPLVFHRHGSPIGDFRKAWRSALRHAGLALFVPHDLRRSMALLHLRAGVPREVTMALAGWKTDSIYRRYLIVPFQPLLEATEKVSALWRSSVSRRKAGRGWNP